MFTKWQRNALFLICCGLLFTHMNVAATDVQSTTLQHPQSAQLLQTYLMIFEIEQEIARLVTKEQRLKQSMLRNQKRWRQQQIVLKEKQVRAAQVLRLYYYGDRSALWLLLFSVRSWSDFLLTYELLDTIFQQDRARLDVHLQAYERLQTTRVTLQAQRNALNKQKRRLTSERQRVSTLTKKLENQLGKQANSEQMMQQLRAFAKQWQTQGLPLFHLYFSSMAQSVADLPRYVISRKQFRGTSLFISDRQLNEYLRKMNPIFRDVTITFIDGQVVVVGQQAGTKVTIRGHYDVKETPKNVLLFNIDELRYQGYRLPDTTIRYLANTYDLSIYPDMMSNMANVRAIIIEKGKITIKTKLNL